MSVWALDLLSYRSLASPPPPSRPSYVRFNLACPSSRVNLQAKYFPLRSISVGACGKVLNLTAAGMRCLLLLSPQFIVLTWTCNTDPSPSLFSAGFALALERRRAKTCGGRNGDARGALLFPSAKHCLVSAGGHWETLQGRYRPPGAVEGSQTCNRNRTVEAEEGTVTWGDTNANGLAQRMC